MRRAARELGHHFWPRFELTAAAQPQPAGKREDRCEDVQA